MTHSQENGILLITNKHGNQDHSNFARITRLLIRAVYPFFNLRPMLNKWSKYNNRKNIRSLPVERGKMGSEYYIALLKCYGTEEADKRYYEFRYQVSHGQKPPLTIKFIRNG